MGFILLNTATMSSLTVCDTNLHQPRQRKFPTAFVSHSANAFLVRRDLLNLAVRYLHAQNRKRFSPENGPRWMCSSSTLACVLFETRSFLVLFLSSSHPLMSDGPDSRSDYYWPRGYTTFSCSTQLSKKF